MVEVPVAAPIDVCLASLSSDHHTHTQFLVSLTRENMHHCLRITEIVVKIFEEVDEYAYDPLIPGWATQRCSASTSALAALARTCSIFKEPALKQLWRDVPDLSILIIHLLPPELVIINNSDCGPVVVSTPSNIWSFDTQNALLYRG